MTDKLETRAPEGFRVRPHNIEAEQALLGAILINNLAYSRVADLVKAEHFYEPVHGRIFGAMAELIGSGQLANHITLKAAFEADESLKGVDGSLYLSRLALAAECVLNVQDYALCVHELARLRGIIALAEEAANVAYDTSPDMPNAADQIQKLQAHVDELALDHTTDSWRSVSQVVDGIVQRLGQPQEWFSTSLEGLDSKMSGGVQPGLVYGFEARPKQAKSMLLGTIALSLMRQSCPFLFLALEMGSARILERMIAHESKCNAVRFRHAEDREDLIGRVRAFGDRYNARRAYFADEPGMSFARLKQVATAAVAKLGIRVLFVDYWQLVTGLGRGQSKADFMSDVAQWLAAFAASNHCAVLIASQENRGGESFGSDGLAKACDWLSVLHKVDIQDRSVGEFEALWMDVKFNRDGMDGRIGSEDAPAFRIDKLGPIVRAFDDWSR